VFSECGNIQLIPNADESQSVGQLRRDQALLMATSIHYFRGKWHAANSRAHGRLGGLAIDGQFYGVWWPQERAAMPGGYLTGDYSYDSQCGEGAQGPFRVACGRAALDRKTAGSVEGQVRPAGCLGPFEDQEF